MILLNEDSLAYKVYPLLIAHYCRKLRCYDWKVQLLENWVYEFPNVAVTNLSQYADWKQCKFILLELWGSEV